MQAELENGDQGRHRPARLEAVAVERDAHGDEGAGDRGGAQHLDHAPERIGKEAGHRPRGRADEDRQDDRVDEHPPHEGRRGDAPPLDHQGRREDHDRQVDGDEEEERHGAFVAVGLEDHRHADEARCSTAPP